MEKINIKAVKLYQSATFEKRSEVHFTVLPVTGKPAIQIELLKDIGCVSIKSDIDHILVPLTNIACIYLWNDAANEYVENKKKSDAVRGTLREQDIKKPR